MNPDLIMYVKRLNTLLEDPQPGLMGWCNAYAECMAWISNYWLTN
jgi:hypothetical protein